MNKILEQTIALIAPYRCLSCGVEGTILCYGCEPVLRLAVSRCYRCHKITTQSSVCTGCRSTVKLNHVWVASEYEDLAKKLLYKLKFDRAKDSSKRIAEIIFAQLPKLPPDALITHIPTANNRVRVRGYDQAELIARHLAKLTGLTYKKTFYRIGRSRQVGSGRKERFAHLEKALKFRTKVEIKGRHVLLVDDVTTTGATIEAAASLLKEAGAETIDSAVFAQPVI